MTPGGPPRAHRPYAATTLKTTGGSLIFNLLKALCTNTSVKLFFYFLTRGLSKTGLSLSHGLFCILFFTASVLKSVWRLSDMFPVI